MSDSVSRRRFMQASSVAASAMVVGATHKTVSANDKIRTGFIGLGGRGRTLLVQILRIPDYEIVALCDEREERLEQTQRFFEDASEQPKHYRDLGEMLENENLDAVIVATEVGRHAEVIIPCLEAGLHCLTEKPLDCTVEKVDAITRAVRQAGVVFQVGFQRRYNPTFHATVAAAQDEEKYGPLRALQGHWHFSGGMGDGGWVRDVEMSGGKLVEQACHHMDVFTWVMDGPPVACQAAARTTFNHQRNVPEHIAEDISGVNFIFEDGTFLTYTHCALLPPQFNNEKIWVIRRDALIDLPEGLVYERISANEGEPQRIADATDYYDGTFQQFEAFIRHIRNNETPLSNVENARISTLTALLAHKAMYNWDEKQYEPSMVHWEDLGTTTDPA